MIFFTQGSRNYVTSICLCSVIVRCVTLTGPIENAMVPPTKPPPRYCRTVHRNHPLMCPVQNFNDFTCMTCYTYLPQQFLFAEWRGRYILELDASCNYGMHWPNGTYHRPQDYNYTNEMSAIWGSIASESTKESWRQCCAAAKKCCQHMLNSPSKASQGDKKYCPKTFDGWQCFEETEAGSIHSSVCEPHLAHFQRSCPKMLTRQCDENGAWPTNVNKTLGTEWTDYNPCISFDPLRNRHKTHVAAFFVTVCAIIPALGILFYYKQLQIPRFAIHKHLFLSLLINAIVFIIFKYLVVIHQLESDIPLISGVSCRFLFALTKYTRSTNFMWMFCEGYYLHKLIVAAFSEQKSLVLFYVIGWGLPVIPAIVYSVWRIYDPEGDLLCWGQDPIEKFEWVVYGPNAISLSVNLLMLLNIIRVLVTKLKQINTNDPQQQYRKAVRATLMLIPLFGLNLFVTMYMPPQNADCLKQEIYYYFLYLDDGLQGFLVTLIFCYFNGEVMFQLRRSFRLWRGKRKSADQRRQTTATIVSTVMSTTNCNGSSENQRRQANEPSVYDTKL